MPPATPYARGRRKRRKGSVAARRPWKEASRIEGHQRPKTRAVNGQGQECSHAYALSGGAPSERSMHNREPGKDIKSASVVRYVRNRCAALNGTRSQRLEPTVVRRRPAQGKGCSTPHHASMPRGVSRYHYENRRGKQRRKRSWKERGRWWAGGGRNTKPSPPRRRA